MRRNDQVVVTFRAKLKQIIDLVSMSVSVIKSRKSGGKDTVVYTAEKNTNTLGRHKSLKGAMSRRFELFWPRTKLPLN